jgi:outer membrane protein assembly factor BamD
MRTKLVFVVLCMVALGAGCSSISVPSMPWSGSAAKPDPTSDALFEEGMRNFNEKKYVRAIDAFTKIKTDHPFSPQLTEAELKIADSFYLNQQYPEAINAFKDFQSMHPSNENIPYVIFRLGEAHFDQVTTTDREQKNTELAKGYFETVVKTYPQSKYAAPAKEKLAKCIGYLAEYDFNVASFYFQQGKYPAARDRFEEIVRKYRGTPVAARSLFFLGESYRKEKNNVKAALAYEALIQYYPESKFTAEAQTQLAQIEKDKQDPLAMLLMRDRRPGAVQETSQDTANAKLKDINNLVAKTDVIYEEPGAEKSVFRRVVDKINFFSSSDDDKRNQETKPENGIDLLAKKKASEEQPGVMTSLWNGINPFGSGSSPAKNTTANANTADAKTTANSKNSPLVNQIDDSLKQKGLDSQTQIAALKAPDADLPKVDEAPPPTMDSVKLLGDIDANLKKGGRNVAELPPAPEAAATFSDPATKAMVAKAMSKEAPAPPPSVEDSGLLGSIDQKLRSQGVEPVKFESSVPPGQENKPSAPRQEQVKTVTLEPKIAVEKGPLFLNPSEAQTQVKPNVSPEPAKEGKVDSSNEKAPEPEVREIPRVLVKGPSQAQTVAAAAKPPEQKRPVAPPDDEENKGVIDYLKQDVESIGKVLNPFRW